MTFTLRVLSAKKSFIGQNKSIWGPLELVEKLCPESANIATSARDLPGIRYVVQGSCSLHTLEKYGISWRMMEQEHEFRKEPNCTYICFVFLIIYQFYYWSMYPSVFLLLFPSNQQSLSFPLLIHPLITVVN